MIVSFDLDGVLMENPFIDHVFPAITTRLQELWKSRTDQRAAFRKETVEASGPTEEEIWDIILNKHQAKLKAANYRAYDWDLITKETAETLGIEAEIEVAELVKKNCTPPAIKSYRDGRDLLCWLRKKDFLLLAITNGFAKYQEPVLKALALDKCFKTIITPDRLKAFKPEAKIFAGVKNKSDWWHIGDSLFMDVWGASRLGAETALVKRYLPESLTSMSPEERVSSPEGQKLLNRLATKEAARQDFQFKKEKLNPEEMRPKLIVDNLKQLKKFLV